MRSWLALVAAVLFLCDGSALPSKFEKNFDAITKGSNFTRPRLLPFHKAARLEDTRMHLRNSLHNARRGISIQIKARTRILNLQVDLEMMRTKISETMERMKVAKEELKSCASYSDCVKTTSRLHKLYLELLDSLDFAQKKALFLSRKFRLPSLQSVVESARSNMFFLKDFTNLVANYLHPGFCIFGLVYTSLAILGFAAVIFVGLFWARIREASGVKFLAVAAGLILAASFRLTYFAFGIGGAGSLVILPVALSHVVPAVYCVAMWYFLYLWASAYFENFVDSSNVRPRRLLLAVVILISVLVPSLVVVQTVLYYGETSPVRGNFPLVSTPVTILMLLLSEIGLVWCCAKYLARFKELEANKEYVNRSYRTSIWRMCVVCVCLIVVHLAALGMSIYSVYQIHNKVELRSSESFLLPYYATIVLDLPFLAGLLFLLFALVLGGREGGKAKDKEAMELLLD